jgi:FkbM family methyltransferase
VITLKASLKIVLRRFSRAAKKLSVFCKYFVLFPFDRGHYKFSFNDLLLFLREKNWKLMVPQIVRSADSESVGFGDVTVSWPSDCRVDGLRWVYNEIFVRWDCNPSSYDHPNLDYRSASWVIDAGVCEGFFAIFALRRGAGRVIGIEPVPILEKCLLETFSRAEYKGKFELIRAALSNDLDNVVRFEYSIDRLWDAGSSQGNKRTKCEVKSTSLDFLMETYRLPVGGIVKMDIEGAEMTALEGGMKLLRRLKPGLAIAVYHGYENARLCARIILEANSSYKIEFRGMNNYARPPRPYMLFAW